MVVILEKVERKAEKVGLRVTGWAGDLLLGLLWASAGAGHGGHSS